jgi:hypothetical protein
MGLRIDKDTFLERARSRFGDRYDYSDVIYRSYRSPIKIRCMEHPVRQIVITPERHLQTTGGCKYCLRNYRNQSLERTLRIDCEAPDRSVRVTRRITIQQPLASAEGKAM